ncbi:hypothetical protein BKA81DRAFT_190628 [Phyllosticta paracitricarpa]
MARLLAYVVNVVVSMPTWVSTPTTTPPPPTNPPLPDIESGCHESRRSILSTTALLYQDHLPHRLLSPPMSHTKSPRASSTAPFCRTTSREMQPSSASFPAI